MKRAMINDGVVTNVFVVDDQNVPGWAEAYPVCPDNTSRGDTYENGVFTKSDRTQDSAGANFSDLEPYQFHAMLEIGGLAQPVRDAIEAMTDRREKAAARAKMEHMKTFDRNDPLVVTLSEAVGVSPAELDRLWQEAATL